MIWEGMWGENMHRYGWKQSDGWMPKGGFAVRNERWIFGWNSFQMGFSGDLFFISVWVVDFPASLSREQSFVAFCTRRRAWAREEMVKCLKSKARTHHRVSVWWACGASGAGGGFREWWSIRCRLSPSENHCRTHTSALILPGKHLSAFQKSHQFSEHVSASASVKAFRNWCTRLKVGLPVYIQVTSLRTWW